MAVNARLCTYCRLHHVTGDMKEQMKACQKVVQLVASSEAVEGGFVQFWLLLELCNEGHVVDL